MIILEKNMWHPHPLHTKASKKYIMRLDTLYCIDPIMCVYVITTGSKNTNFQCISLAQNSVLTVCDDYIQTFNQGL